MLLSHHRCHLIIMPIKLWVDYHKEKIFLTSGHPRIEAMESTSQNARTKKFVPVGPGCWGPRCPAKQGCLGAADVVQPGPSGSSQQSWGWAPDPERHHRLFHPYWSGLDSWPTGWSLSLMLFENLIFVTTRQWELPIQIFLESSQFYVPTFHPQPQLPFNLSHGRMIINTVKTSHIRHTLVNNQIIHHSDVVGASPVGAAPITSWSSF